MKKIIIVNNNLRVGGVQKSLYNLLWAIKDRYDVTLYLFDDTGSYELPENVRVLRCDGPFRYFGRSHAQCKPWQRCKRGFLTLICRLFSRPTAVRLMLLGQKRVKGEYDCAIAYLQNGNIHNLYGGVQDFVIHRIDAKKKVALLHCDYARSGANEPRNNRLIAKFDQVAACSDGCRQSFETTLPQIAARCMTVRNCHKFEEIRALARKEPIEYPQNRRNVLMVTRLAHEKGIERAIAAVAYAKKVHPNICLHIVGTGAMQEQMHALVQELGLQEHIVFYGEQTNPYRFMPQAELLMMTSFYEAAPMVIEEAACVGIPTLTTQTTSSREMIGLYGYICENTQEAINASLCEILSDRDGLEKMKQSLRQRKMDNSLALEQFRTLIEE